MFALKNIPEANLKNLDHNWDSLKINSRLLEIIKDEFKFDSMTNVQAASIPLMLQGKDLIVEARTGTGKTLSFLIPVVELLTSSYSKKQFDNNEVLTLILSPTRELTRQIHQELRRILKKFKFSNDKTLVSHLLTGGNSVSKDLEKFNKHGGNILVSTPGRLQSIMEMKDNHLSQSIRKSLMFLILDEADQLLSLGFEQSISSILAYLPKLRRTSLFSATQTDSLVDLLKSGLRNPIKVNVNALDTGQVHAHNHEPSTRKCLTMADDLQNFYHKCDTYAQKLGTLIELLRQDGSKKTLVFLSTCSQIDYFAFCLETALHDKKMPILRLHRRLKSKRKAIFASFRANKRCILLSTDILSRGIDVPDISLVIHVDLPESPEIYVHRSGRSGHRIDLSGKSLLLVQDHEMDYIEMCRRRSVDLKPMANMKNLIASIDSTSASIVESLRKRAKSDPDFEKLGLQAFVSFIRFYSTKMCLKLLLFPKMSIAQLAKDFGLLRLPKMPELRKNFRDIEAQAGLSNKSITSNISTERPAKSTRKLSKKQ